MRVLVTGSSGHLGEALVRTLRRLNHEVVSIDRVYVNEKARNELGWKPRYDFQFLVERLKQDKDTRSPLARLVGSKGYHEKIFSEGPYPVEKAKS